MLTHRGMIPAGGGTVPDGVLRVRLVDTLAARVWEGELIAGPGVPASDVVTCYDRGLVFMGEDIGQHHIHVAAWGSA
jgi:hypothetical protein